MTARIIGNGGENVTPQVTAQTSLIEQMSAALSNGDGAPDFIPEYPMTEDLLPSAIDTDGSIYNGIGYIENYRWSLSEGDIVATSGYFVTGYIPYNNDDILYIKPSGSILSNLEYLIAFDASFNNLGAMFTGGSYGYTVADILASTLKLTKYTNTAYIRISGPKATGIPVIRKAIK